jgi:hypothetical protein
MKKLLGTLALVGIGIYVYNQYKKSRNDKKPKLS